MSREAARRVLALHFELDMRIRDDVVVCISSPSDSAAQELKKLLLSGRYGLFNELVGSSSCDDAPELRTSDLADRPGSRGPEQVSDCALAILPVVRYGSCPVDYLEEQDLLQPGSTIIHFLIKPSWLVRRASAITRLVHPRSPHAQCDGCGSERRRCNPKTVHIECIRWMGEFTFICRSDTDLTNGFGRKDGAA